MSNKYVLLFLLLCTAVISAFSQTEPAADSLLINPQADSLLLPPPDTLQTDTLSADTVAQTADTLAAPQGDIETTVNYQATDSLHFDVKDQTVYMYGNAKVDYGSIKLEAARITTNWDTQLLTAQGVPDTTGKVIGKPLFTDGPEQYTTDNIRYNFKTRKAIIKGIVTQQQEAFIHGETVKKTPENALMISHARYTTCNLENPHFHIEAEKLKVLPNDKIISGPFHLKFADVSTPLGFLFGMFPAPRKRVSGILVPSYGEERNRGFFLREGGYYLALNEYVDLAITGEIYSKGSRGIALASNYRKRYAYNGNFNVRFNRQNTSENEAIENISKDLWVTWSHSPQSKGKGRFSASVNGGTSTYTTNNPSQRDIDRNLTQQFTSNVSYSYNNIFNSPFSFSSRANMVQDISRKTVDLTLPDVSIMMNRQFPFRGLGKGTGKSWYEQISVGYTFNATNRLTNKAPSSGFNFEVANPDPLGDSIVAFNQQNMPIIWDRARIGARHTVPISTSFNILKYFQVSPSFTYDEFWFLKKLQYSDAVTNADTITSLVRVDTVGGFSRAGVWNLGTGLSTKLFGTFYFNKKNPEPLIQAVRHMIVPSVSFSYRPDFTRDQYGYFQNVRTGGMDRTTGLERIQTLSVYNAFAYQVPGGRESGALSFGLTNNLEMKVRSRSDTAVEYVKMPILKNLSVNSSYDLIAEEFKLGNFRVSGNTSFLDNLITLNFGFTVNPYAYQLDSVYFNNKGERKVNQEMINVYAWDAGQGFGHLEMANFNISTNLSPATFKKGGKDKGKDPVAGVDNNTQATPLVDDEMAYMYDDPNLYVDFTIPWTLRFNYTFNYSKPGFAESTIRQGTRFSGDIKVTEKWKVGFQSGFDIQKREFTQTSLNIFRDLHCWQMAVNWIPFGAYQSFSVDINVKAAVLQDLKLSRRRSWFDQ